MSKRLLEFNIPHPLPEDYDPILGRSIGEISNTNSSATVVTIPNNDNIKTSVFDDPELDFAYRSPIKEELPQLSAEDIAIILEEDTSTEPVINNELELAATEETLQETSDDLGETKYQDAEITETLPQSEILHDDIELDPEITPFETMDGAANEAIKQAEEDNNLSDRWRMADDEILENQKEEIIANASETAQDIIPQDEIAIETIISSEAMDHDAEEIANELPPSEDSIDAIEDITTDANADEVFEESDKQEPIEAAENTSSPIIEEQNSGEIKDIQPSLSETPGETASELFDEPIFVPPPQDIKRKPKGKKRRKAKKTNEFALMGGVFFSGMAILFLISTLAAPLGKPFSDIASYGIVWSVFALIGAIIWAILRNWQMTIASLLCLLGFVANIVPTLGDAPIGGKGDANIVGWANVENSPKALQSFVSQGEKNGATLLIVAGANKLIAGNIPNWSVIQVPIANDPTSLAVLAKENWRAVTLPGEPTMARPLDNSLTVMGVNPSLGAPKDNAIINRAANRMGDQDTAVLTVGDFGIVPWDRTMKDFTKTSGAKRIRCGGIFGTTYNQGLLNTATDHAFGFNAKIQSCEIGESLPQSHHKPLFVKVFKH